MDRRQLRLRLQLLRGVCQLEICNLLFLPLFLNKWKSQPLIFTPVSPVVPRPVVRPMEIDPSHATMGVSTPSQASQVEEHFTRKSVPGQLDSTTMYGSPVASRDKPARLSQPSLYRTQLLCVQYV